MDDRKLEIFLKVVEVGSFSKAADALSCTQSAVTQAIKRLEKELDCVLLKRDYQGVYLTDVGERLYPEMKDIYVAMCALGTHARSLQHDQIIRVGAFASIANSWLMDLIVEYQKVAPKSRFEMVINTSDLQSMLDQDEIDIAFGDDRRLRKEIFLPLFEDQLKVVAPITYKFDSEILTRNDIEDLPFLMASRNVLQDLLPWQPSKPIRVDVDDDRTLIKMVEKGMGITIMPQLSLQDSNADIRIYDYVDILIRHIGVSYLKKNEKQLKSFVSFIQKYQKH